MDILNKNTVRLKSDVRNITTRNNPDSSSGIYITVEVAKCRMVADNRREKEE